MSKPMSWRVQSDDDGGFDELVVGGNLIGREALIHAEMMDRRSIFVSIGSLCIWATVDKKGRVKVTGTEDRSKERTSPTSSHEQDTKEGERG